MSDSTSMVSRFAKTSFCSPSTYRPSKNIIEYEMFLLQCPWCGLETWCYSYSSDIELHQTYKFYGGPGEGSDCSCWFCGRGIYAYWTEWVIYAEYDGPKGGTLIMRDYSGHNYSSGGKPSRPGEFSTTEGKYPETLDKANRLWKRDPKTGKTGYYIRDEYGWGIPLCR